MKHKWIKCTLLWFRKKKRCIYIIWLPMVVYDLFYTTKTIRHHKKCMLPQRLRLVIKMAGYKHVRSRFILHVLIICMEITSTTICNRKLYCVLRSATVQEAIWVHMQVLVLLNILTQVSSCYISKNKLYRFSECLGQLLM